MYNRGDKGGEKLNRFKRGEEWRNMMEGGCRQYNISKGLARATELVKKQNKKRKKEKENTRRGWGGNKRGGRGRESSPQV